MLASVAVLIVADVHAVLEEVDAIAAIVDDDVVLVSELLSRYELFVAQAKQTGATEIPPRETVLNQLMERLIVESLQIQEAERRGIIIDDETLTEAVTTFAGQNGMDLDGFQQSLAEEGVSYRSFREDIRREMLLSRVQRDMVNRQIYITEQDVADLRGSPFFKEWVSDQYRVGHILLRIEDPLSNVAVRAANDMAVDILGKLRIGEEFGKLAIAHSAGSTALEGGDLGWRRAAELPSLFSETVIELEIGETPDPITNSLGIHIIQLLDKRGASMQKELRTQVRHILVQPSEIKSEQLARSEIDRVRERIIAGEDFAELAREVSDDAGTALAGGDLGWRDSGDFVGEFRGVMDAIPENEISEVFRSQFGWHILEVLGRREEDMSQESLDDMALQILHTRRYDEKLEEWLKQIRDEAYVQIRLNED
ncbi:MAG: peptidylprolyl isomerase [Pseudomonadales bacterium]|nr:peptidylprolyl isomerase [Pseudomonadales bacterium]